jgi:hypothetical protein
MGAPGADEKMFFGFSIFKYNLWTDFFFQNMIFPWS